MRHRASKCVIVVYVMCFMNYIHSIHNVSICSPNKDKCRSHQHDLADVTAVSMHIVLFWMPYLFMVAV